MKNHFLFFLIILFFAEVQSQSLLKEIENKDNKIFLKLNIRCSFIFFKTWKPENDC